MNIIAGSMGGGYRNVQSVCNKDFGWKPEIDQNNLKKYEKKIDRYFVELSRLKLFSDSSKNNLT